MRRKRIWIISELFYPDEASTGYIMTIIAMAIANDNDVHVICGPAGYNKLAVDEQRKFDFTIHRINAPSLSKDGIFGRLIRLLVISIGMFFKGLFAIGKNDTAFIVTNPAFIIPFYAIIKKIKGNKLIILVHDVFPENLIASKIIASKKNLVYKLTKQIFDWSYQQANNIITLGADMLEIMQTKCKSSQNIVVIENWANVIDIYPQDITSNELVTKFNLQNKTVFTFAGNMGRVQGLELLFNIIKEVTNPVVHFLFIGDGALVTELKAIVHRNNIKSVTFAGALPRSKQNTFLNAAHFGLVTLSAEIYGLGVPSKSYNIMAAGKPILFIGNKRSEIGKMVIEKKCGLAFDEKETDNILAFFNSISNKQHDEFEQLGKNARRLAENCYSENAILNKFKAILNG